MSGSVVLTHEPLPKPKRQQVLPRRKSILPWKHPRPPSLTPTIRQQSLTQMIPGLTPARYEVVDSEPDEDIEEPPPKKQRVSSGTRRKRSPSTSKPKPQRTKRRKENSQDDYTPAPSKAKKIKSDQDESRSVKSGPGRREKARSGPREVASEAKKPKNTLTQAYNFVRSDSMVYYGNEDELGTPTTRTYRNVAAHDGTIWTEAGNEEMAYSWKDLEIPNSSSQARAGDEPYQPWGGLVGESPNEQQRSSETPHKKMKYARVDEMPNSQPTPTLTPKGKVRRPALQPKSANVRFVSPSAAKYHRNQAAPGDDENTPRPRMKSLSSVKSSPTERPQTSTRQARDFVNDSTEDEDEDCMGERIATLGETNVYNTMSDSQWQVAIDLLGLEEAREQVSTDVMLSLTQLIERTEGIESHFLHMQHLKKVKAKRDVRSGKSATLSVREHTKRSQSNPRHIELVEDSEDENLDSDANGVYESAVEDGQCQDEEEPGIDGDDFDLGPRTFNPVDDALDRDASRFFMTQTQALGHLTKQHDLPEPADDDRGLMLQSQIKRRGMGTTQIKEEAVDRIPSTQERPQPTSVPTENKLTLQTSPAGRYSRWEEEQEGAMVFSTAAESGEIVIHSSQAQDHAAFIQEDLLLERDDIGDELTVPELPPATVNPQEIVPGTPPATARLQPSQVSTILPTQASQLRLLTALVEDEEEEAIMHRTPSLELSSSQNMAGRLNLSSPHLHQNDSAPTSPASPGHITQHIDLLKDLEWQPENESLDDEQAALPLARSEGLPSQQLKSVSTNQSSPLIGPPGYNSNDCTRKTSWSQTQMTNVVDYSLPPPPPLSSARQTSD